MRLSGNNIQRRRRWRVFLDDLRSLWCSDAADTTVVLRASEASLVVRCLVSVTTSSRKGHQLKQAFGWLLVVQGVICAACATVPSTPAVPPQAGLRMLVGIGYQVTGRDPIEVPTLQHICAWGPDVVLRMGVRDAALARDGLRQLADFPSCRATFLQERLDLTPLQDVASVL